MSPIFKIIASHLHPALVAALLSNSLWISEGLSPLSSCPSALVRHLLVVESQGRPLRGRSHSQHSALLKIHPSFRFCAAHAPGFPPSSLATPPQPLPCLVFLLLQLNSWWSLGSRVPLSLSPYALLGHFIDLQSYRHSNWFNHLVFFRNTNYWK